MEYVYRNHFFEFEYSTIFVNGKQVWFDADNEILDYKDFEEFVEYNYDELIEKLYFD
ncbi:MAG: hypothetical protein ACFFCI_02365 [Promethearchaeota archaeon]